jgi:hypothetical protein
MIMTPNFRESEITSWPVHQSMTEDDRRLAIRLATEHLTDDVRANARRIAQFMQLLRDGLNHIFPEYNGNIGLRAVSWFRPVAWERHRRRDGSSQHTTGHAVDFIAVIHQSNVQPSDIQNIMNAAWNILQNWHGGLARLHRGNRTSFIHIDLGTRRRWDY